MAKLKFHPLFVIYVFVCLYFGWMNSVFYYVVTVVLHEYGHLIAMKIFGYHSLGINFNVYGAGLKSQNIYKRKHDIIISMAGPFVNIILIILNVCLWWVFPSIYVFTIDFVNINLVVLIFNLLPIYPLDGGRVLFAILENKINRRKLAKVNCVICMCLGVFFVLVFVCSLFYTINLNLLFVGLFLCVNCIVYDKNIYFEKIKALNKSKNKDCEIKYFLVKDFDVNKLIKYINLNYYSIFVKIENGKNIYINEDDLLKKFY